MTEQTRECLERAVYCTRLAESESATEVRVYLLTLAASWTRAARKTVEKNLDDA
jgi:hypothetical protein